jgi:hypothetical protein
MTPFWQEKSSQNVFFLHMKNGNSNIHTYVSDIYIKNKEKHMYMWSRLGVVASSERIILIALAGKHIWLFLWWKGVSHKTTNVSKENDDNAFVHLSMKKRRQRLSTVLQFVYYVWVRTIIIIIIIIRHLSSSNESLRQCKFLCR